MATVHGAVPANTTCKLASLTRPEVGCGTTDVGRLPEQPTTAILFVHTPEKRSASPPWFVPFASARYVCLNVQTEQSDSSV